MQKNRFLILLTVGWMAFNSCERADEEDINGNLEPRLTSIQRGIFDLSCSLSGCHSSSNPAQGLNLTTEETFSNTVNISSREVPTLMRISPGNPDQSYLYLKLLGATNIVGGRMPLGRPALTTEEIDIIRQWIEEGALNN